MALKQFSRKVFVKQVFADNAIIDALGNLDFNTAGTLLIDVGQSMGIQTVLNFDETIGDTKNLITTNGYVEQIGANKDTSVVVDRNIIINGNYSKQVNGFYTKYVKGDSNVTYGESPGSGNSTIRTYNDDVTHVIPGTEAKTVGNTSQETIGGDKYIAATKIASNASIPGSYANNAAAVVAGLNPGDLYFTTVAGDDIVKRVV